MNLQNPITNIKGIGDARAEKLKKLGIVTIKDLIEHFPRDYQDRSKITSIADAEIDEVVSVSATVIDTSLSRIKNLLITKIKLSDGTGNFEAVWFNQPYLKNNFKKGEKFIFTGTLTERFKRLQMESPDYEQEKGQELLNSGRIIPIYHATAGLSQKLLRKMVNVALEAFNSEVEENLPLYLVKKYNLISRHFSVKNIHFPESDESFFLARNRLVFEELFFMQILLMKLKGLAKESASFAIQEINTEPILSSFSFELTDAQKKVQNEILVDLQSGFRMNRLVQGDVGSGKTAIAMVAAYVIVKSEKQVALMAPTEVLARQHLESFTNVFSALGIQVALLISSQTRGERKLILENIQKGVAQIVIGTHAIIQDKVQFKDLGLVITDEQHRFGVRQRLILSEKGENPHVLVMTATPIPRSLALILYGDMDISIVDSLPPGRQKIETYAVNANYRERLYEFIKKEINTGRQAYMICPSIETNLETDKPLESVTELVEKLKDVFIGIEFACLHGKMKTDEKQQIMESFARNQLKLLISTTVIEVGVNVPNATVMVIENAERFGLAQLHQLRGRVGRSVHKSYCVLITDSKSKICKRRMKAMTESNDGFYISELDLELRGAGDFFGTRQHGLPEMKIANLYEDIEILKQAQEAAYEVIKNDKELEREEHRLIAREITDNFTKKVTL